MALSEATNEFQQREFPMTDSDFKTLSSIAYNATGIVLGDHKRNLVYSRLARRIRSLSLNSFKTYCDVLEGGNEEELDNFVNAITTNLTSFFRESHHFDFLEELLERKRKEGKRSIRIWSAGCSTGEEPYSIAITIRKVFGDSHGYDVKLLATDLDSNVLNHGREGIYDYSRVEALDKRIISTNFSKNVGGSQVKVKPEIRKYIQFNRLNLLSSWPMTKKFDVIFCRNVVIYFNKETQKVLFDRYAQQLNEDGYLIIGHSENLHGVTTRFKSLGRTIYKRVK